MAALVSSVIAADLPVKAQPTLAAPSWSGFYAGVHGGWGWRSTYINDELYNPAFHPTVVRGDSPAAGGQIGVNRQYGNFVYGLELDASWMPVKGNTARDQTIIVTSDQVIDLHALVTGTGRVGYAMGPWLFYAKGGGAWADIKMTTKYLASGVTEYDQSWFGAVAGGGIEVAFLRNVSAKIEYNFLYFPAQSFVWTSPDSHASIDHSFQMVKAGINVRFGDDRAFVR